MVRELLARASPMAPQQGEAYEHHRKAGHGMTDPVGDIAIELRPDQQERLEEIAARRGVPLIALLAEAMSSWSATHGRDGLSGLDARFQGRQVDADALTEVGREAVDWWLRSPHVRDAS